ncbi:MULTISPECIES: class I adenylate-forming enzyme family protein [Paenibacillus]|uniref:Acyl-CoA synthetase n=1 Tax=Paenibacillus borealis TaxID=160799 RepID=A0ABX3H498_PAEBO|nr:fatty acid--CoA ligase family protein [Paenibacillus borealis]OMD42332.1 hypothetical protein BSK56_25910 [Paenibacillus borealis]
MLPIITDLLKLLDRQDELLASSSEKWFQGNEIAALAGDVEGCIQESPYGAVGISSSSGPHFLAVLLTAMKAERPQILFGSKWPMHELQSALLSSPCSILISDQDRVKDLVVEDWDMRRAGHFYVWTKKGRLQPICPDGEWLGQFTSGTTGRSRLVIRSWDAIADEIHALEEAVELPEGGTFFNMAPFHHSYGFCGGFIWPLLRGSKVYTVSDFFPSACRKRWVQLQPVVVYGLPFQYEFISTSPGEDVPVPIRAFSAGGPLTGDLREKAYANLGILISNNYGCTEAGTLCIYPEMPPEENSSSVGWPLPNRRFQIIEGNQLSVTGKCLMDRYFDSPPVSIPYRTGDLGAIREDGCVQVSGRLRHVIQVGGVKVSPEKVEDALKSHPAVAEAVVMGKPSPGFHEQVHAFIELVNPGSVREEELREYCKLCLLPVEVPKRIFILDQIPKSDTGKVQGKYLIEVQ